jgi:nicotinate dehydrogenase subunit A
MTLSKMLSVNGERVSLTVDDPNMPLLYALRDNLGLHGPRFGCGLGQCGACTVHIDGAAVRSCVMPLWGLSPHNKIVTLEGLGTPEKPHPVQRAFIEEQAAQCGYCINGMIMESAAFLAKNRAPSEATIKNALANNLCRCGTQLRIVKAVLRASMDIERSNG